jgi:predicted alpha-1,6-mannanase (GH76 family)
MPLTHLGRIAHPAPRSGGGLIGTWNYWWQAHYLDAIVDSGLRALGAGDSPGAVQHCRSGDRLLRTVRLRNGFRWTNAYYDDMAWLALACGRLADLRRKVDGTAGQRRYRRVEYALTRQLRSALTDDLGGGLFWNTTRDFKNVPASGPAALHFARLGDTRAARQIVDWLYDRLWSPESGLFLDGIRIVGGSERVVPDLWSYNQGTVLGTLVTLGDAASFRRAADLVAAVDSRMTTHVSGSRLLRTHGGGDGGLFTGILARYLALAATTTGLDTIARETAGRLVRDTADALWMGRAELRLAVGQASRPATVFSPDPTMPAQGGPPGDGALELSSQLQAWTVLEAAATLS